MAEALRVTPKTKILIDNEVEVLKLYLEGVSISKLAQRFTVHLSTVICFLRSRNVRLRTKREAMLICWTDDDRAKMSVQRKGIRRTFGRRWKYDRFIAKPGIRGPLNGMWRGGTKALGEKIRQCEFYKRWRTAVYERDGYTCRWCGEHGGKLRADHVIPFSVLVRWYAIKSVEDAARCAAFWDTNNGRTLCHDCHTKTATYAGKMNGGMWQKKR